MNPRPIVIDTDPGVDDAVAIMLALASPEVEVRAITSVFGNVPLPVATRNAGSLLALCGRSDIPLAEGADRPLVHPQTQRAEKIHGGDGLGGRAAALPEPATAPDPRPAVPLLADVLRASSEPVTLVPIGPITNIALLLAAYPALAPNIERIIWMGGSLSGGNTTGAAEFNAYSDPEAAHRVLTQADVPVTMVPLDITLRCAAGPEWVEALGTAGPRCAELAQVIAHYRAAFRAQYGKDAVAVHDAVAVLEAIVPGTLATTAQPVAASCELGPARGATIPVADGPKVEVAMDADTDAVLTEIRTRLSRLG